MHGRYLPGDTFLSSSQALTWKEGGKVAKGSVNGSVNGSGATAGNPSQMGLGCWLRE